jgi:membrane-bound metal-dependent hydrolase YbcI (DUF457 family)
VPSPLAHALAGLSVHLAASAERRDAFDRWRMLVTVGAALAPDTDLLFRFVDGRNHHNNELHGVGFALLTLAAAAPVFRLLGWRRPFGLALAAAAAWTSHILLDYLNVDTSVPIGLMALWPFSARHFKSPVPIFLDIWRTLSPAGIRHNAVAAAIELAVLGPVLAAVWRGRTRRWRQAAWREGSKARP